MSYDPLFEKAVETVLAHEGGLADHPDDPGGVTKYGISLRFLQTIRPEATKRDIAELDADDARNIYYTEFWAKARFAELPDAVAVKVFDLAVNTGIAPAVKCLQRALRACGFLTMKDDGVLGDRTLAASRSVSVASQLVALRSEAAGHYRLLAAKNKRLNVFLTGWLARAYS